VVSWHPSPASRAKVDKAPVSAVPLSYQQAQHVRGYRSHLSNGRDMARLNMPAWDIPGQCDVRAMTHVINAYLRRHDTYHSWFELTDTDDIVRRTVTNPRDIAFVPTKHGEMSATEWRCAGTASRSASSSVPTTSRSTSASTTSTPTPC
jgi:hypothetical protein